MENFFLKVTVNPVKIFKQFFYPIHWMSGRNNHGYISVGSKGSFKVSPRFCYFELTRRVYTGPSQVIGLFKLPNKNYYSAVLYSLKLGFFMIIAPQYFDTNVMIHSYSNVFTPGSSLRIQDVPIGYRVYNLAMPWHRRAVYTRSAGCGSLVVAREYSFSLLKLSSGFLKKFYRDTVASFGTISVNFNIRKFIRAGSFMVFGRKPRVRGVAKNPVDHPHGGGEGKKSKPRAPRSPWGWLTVRYSSVRVRKLFWMLCSDFLIYIIELYQCQ